jgi:hypothetical protein
MENWCVEWVPGSSDIMPSFSFMLPLEFSASAHPHHGSIQKNGAPGLVHKPTAVHVSQCNENSFGPFILPNPMD